MISPADVAAEILARVPAPLAPPQPVPSPLFAAAAELAGAVGGDPSRVLGAADALASDRGAIVENATQAASLVEEAGRDLVFLAAQYQANAASLLPLVFNPVTAAGALGGIASATVSTLARAQERLARLEAELAAPTAALARIVAEAADQPSLEPSASALSATRELQTLAAGVEPAAAEATEHAPAAPQEPAAGGEGSAAGRAAVEAAKSQLGTPYAWGGTGPGGFDCSGLTSWAYRQAGVELPRMAHEQAIGRQVSYDQLQPGDLAVWDGHVAMYAGDGMYIEAGDPVQMNPVRTENIGMAFHGFWRPTG
ncbi:C40 family peptidase [Corynebacterium senegalense]|uniref:C40 family peptidase n=1 Tax=Corynebacterium senegalense TaxID=2080750 RepID=UPI000E20A65C|nr:C40 family peptidase [Corynebacterium senegalense]